MIKKLKECSLKEVKTYHKTHPVDEYVNLLLVSAFYGDWDETEQCWKYKINIELRKYFKEDVFEHLIEVSDD